jgi:hypothetical protein
MTGSGVLMLYLSGLAISAHVSLPVVTVTIRRTHYHLDIHRRDLVCELM